MSVKHVDSKNSGDVLYATEWNKDHAIDVIKLREEMEFLLLCQAIPLWFQNCPVGYPTYDGEYLKIVCGNGVYPAIGTAFRLTHWSVGDTASVTRAYAIVRAVTDASWYPFFLERTKAEYDYFQGFNVAGTTHYVESRLIGVETDTDIDPQNFSVDVELNVMCLWGTKTEFRVDGALEATHLTNISTGPFHAIGAEPNGVANTVYLKYPRGIYLG